MNLTEAADATGISARTLRLAVARGEIEADRRHTPDCNSAPVDREA